RFMRAYANDPDNALKKTTAREIAVTSSAGSFGYSNKSMGTRINPPPAPMRVPNAPINIPNGKSHKYSTGMSRLIFSFQLKFRETRLRTDICQSKRTRGIEGFLAAAQGIKQLHYPNNGTVGGEKRDIVTLRVPTEKSVGGFVVQQK